MSKPARVLLGILGFAIGAALMFAIEVAFAEWAEIRPRGLAWIAFPFVVGVFSWRMTYNADLGANWIVRIIQTQKGRAIIFGTVGWCLFWTFLAFNSDLISENSWWSNNDWTRFYQWLLGVPLLAAVGLLGFRWVRQGRKDFV